MKKIEIQYKTKKKKTLTDAIVLLIEILLAIPNWLQFVFYQQTKGNFETEIREYVSHTHAFAYKKGLCFNLQLIV